MSPAFSKGAKRPSRYDSFAPRVIYTSDLQRAARTAEIIAAHVEAPVITDAGFRERYGGEWQGHKPAVRPEIRRSHYKRRRQSISR